VSFDRKNICAEFAVGIGGGGGGCKQLITLAYIPTFKYKSDNGVE
ncbi:MAG: hypothetical protein QG570_737, partial [Patescibacteria group bacterium]|nr:hypothetical protein [Patescibacteria group bacterium]